MPKRSSAGFIAWVGSVAKLGSTSSLVTQTHRAGNDNFGRYAWL
jgi:hypothetical protein